MSRAQASSAAVITRAEKLYRDIAKKPGAANEARQKEFDKLRIEADGSRLCFLLAKAAALQALDLGTANKAFKVVVDPQAVREETPSTALSGLQQIAKWFQRAIRAAEHGAANFNSLDCACLYAFLSACLGAEEDSLHFLACLLRKPPEDWNDPANDRTLNDPELFPFEEVKGLDSRGERVRHRLKVLHQFLGILRHEVATLRGSRAGFPPAEWGQGIFHAPLQYIIQQTSKRHKLVAERALPLQQDRAQESGVTRVVLQQGPHDIRQRPVPPKPASAKRQASPAASDGAVNEAQVVDHLTTQMPAGSHGQVGASVKQQAHANAMAWLKAEFSISEEELEMCMQRDFKGKQLEEMKKVLECWRSRKSEVFYANWLSKNHSFEEESAMFLDKILTTELQKLHKLVRDKAHHAMGFVPSKTSADAATNHKQAVSGVGILWEGTVPTYDDLQKGKGNIGGNGGDIGHEASAYARQPLAQWSAAEVAFQEGSNLNHKSSPVKAKGPEEHLECLLDNASIVGEWLSEAETADAMSAYATGQPLSKDLVSGIRQMPSEASDGEGVLNHLHPHVYICNAYQESHANDKATATCKTKGKLLLKVHAMLEGLGGGAAPDEQWKSPILDELETVSLAAASSRDSPKSARARPDHIVLRWMKHAVRVLQLPSLLAADEGMQAMSKEDPSGVPDKLTDPAQRFLTALDILHRSHSLPNWVMQMISCRLVHVLPEGRPACAVCFQNLLQLPNVCMAELSELAEALLGSCWHSVETYAKLQEAILTQEIELESCGDAAISWHPHCSDSPPPGERTSAQQDGASEIGVFEGDSSSSLQDSNGATEAKTTLARHIQMLFNGSTVTHSSLLPSAAHDKAKLLTQLQAAVVGLDQATMLLKLDADAKAWSADILVQLERSREVSPLKLESGYVCSTAATFDVLKGNYDLYKAVGAWYKALVQQLNKLQLARLDAAPYHGAAHRSKGEQSRVLNGSTIDKDVDEKAVRNVLKRNINTDTSRLGVPFNIGDEDITGAMARVHAAKMCDKWDAETAHTCNQLFAWGQLFMQDSAKRLVHLSCNLQRAASAARMVAVRALKLVVSEARVVAPVLLQPYVRFVLRQRLQDSVLEAKVREQSAKADAFLAEAIAEQDKAKQLEREKQEKRARREAKLRKAQAEEAPPKQEEVKAEAAYAQLHDALAAGAGAGTATVELSSAARGSSIPARAPPQGPAAASAPPCPELASGCSPVDNPDGAQSGCSSKWDLAAPLPAKEHVNSSGHRRAPGPEEDKGRLANAEPPQLSIAIPAGGDSGLHAQRKAIPQAASSHRERAAGREPRPPDHSRPRAGSTGLDSRQERAGPPGSAAHGAEAPGAGRQASSNPPSRPPAALSRAPSGAIGCGVAAKPCTGGPKGPCPHCRAQRPHSVERCPVLDGLPEGKLQEVVARYQRGCCATVQAYLEDVGFRACKYCGSPMHKEPASCPEWKARRLAESAASDMAREERRAGPRSQDARELPRVAEYKHTNVPWSAEAEQYCLQNESPQSGAHPGDAMEGSRHAAEPRGQDLPTKRKEHRGKAGVGRGSQAPCCMCGGRDHRHASCALLEALSKKGRDNAMGIITQRFRPGRLPHAKSKLLEAGVSEAAVEQWAALQLSRDAFAVAQHAAGSVYAPDMEAFINVAAASSQAGLSAKLPEIAAPTKPAPALSYLAALQAQPDVHLRSQVTSTGRAEADLPSPGPRRAAPWAQPLESAEPRDGPDEDGNPVQCIQLDANGSTPDGARPQPDELPCAATGQAESHLGVPSARPVAWGHDLGEMPRTAASSPSWATACGDGSFHTVALDSPDDADNAPKSAALAGNPAASTMGHLFQEERPLLPEDHPVFQEELVGQSGPSGYPAMSLGMSQLPWEPYVPHGEAHLHSLHPSTGFFSSSHPVEPPSQRPWSGSAEADMPPEPGWDLLLHGPASVSRALQPDLASQPCIKPAHGFPHISAGTWCAPAPRSSPLPGEAQFAGHLDGEAWAGAAHHFGLQSSTSWRLPAEGEAPARQGAPHAQPAQSTHHTQPAHSAHGGSAAPAFALPALHPAELTRPAWLAPAPLAGPAPSAPPQSWASMVARSAGGAAQPDSSVPETPGAVSEEEGAFWDRCSSEGGGSDDYATLLDALGIQAVGSGVTGGGAEGNGVGAPDPVDEERALPSAPPLPAFAGAGSVWEGRTLIAAEHALRCEASSEGSAPEVRHEGEEDDAELQAAIQASLEEEERAPLRLGAPPGASTGPAGGVGVTATPGLANATGEYNCFLNVVVQCLWHCASFRAALLALPPPCLEGHAVVAALAQLFHAFEAQQGAAMAEATAAARHVVNPAALREALAASNASRFGLGEMSDAAEVLGALWEALREVQGGAALVDAAFGLHVAETVPCGACGRTSHETQYTQHLHTAPATSLRMLASTLTPEEGLGALLNAVEAQHHKSCNEDTGGCGRLCPVRHVLEGEPPSVFALQVAWESQREASKDIRDTMALIGKDIDLSQVYQGMYGAQVYQPISAVCFYGSHYHAFVRRATDDTWLMYDDATAAVVGEWGCVVAKCFLGKIQASVLFYEHLPGPLIEVD